MGETVLEPEQRERALVLLAAEPRPSYAEVARVLGVDWQVIRRLDLRTREQLAADKRALRALDEYGRRFEREMPIKERVKLYAEIARSGNPYAAQKALERIDELQGIITARQRKDAEAAPQLAPVFMLPPGTRLAIATAPAQEPPLPPSLTSPALPAAPGGSE